MSPDQWRRAVLALGAMLLLVVGCTRPTAPGNQPPAPSPIVVPSAASNPQLASPSIQSIATTAVVIEPSAGPGSVVAPDAAQELRATARRVTVVKIVDGDTFDVNSGKERVRLLTVDTPELHAYSQPPRPPECGAVAARDAFAALMPIGSQVLLRGLPGEAATDGSNPPRTLSNVYVEHDGS